jgi:hypothetical protein
MGWLFIDALPDKKRKHNNEENNKHGELETFKEWYALGCRGS